MRAKVASAAVVAAVAFAGLSGTAGSVGARALQPSFPTQVRDQVITFEHDSDGDVSNGFTSHDSRFVHFSNTGSDPLDLLSCDQECGYTRALLVGYNTDPNALLMRLDRP